MQSRLTLAWVCGLQAVDMGMANAWRVAPDLLSARLVYALAPVAVLLYPLAAGCWLSALVVGAVMGIAWAAVASLYLAGSIAAGKAVLLGMWALGTLIIAAMATQETGLVKRILYASAFGGLTETVGFTLGELSARTWSPPEAVSLLAQTFGPWASALQLTLIFLAYLIAVGWPDRVRR